MKRVFIGSSIESLEVAYAAQRVLKRFFAVKVWDQDVFRPSDYIIHALMEELDNSDFGIFVFAPDDIVKIREQEYSATRDNIIFELGLFMGRLGKDRCYILSPTGTMDHRLPTDLLGLTIATYDPEENLLGALVPACYAIKDKINYVGKIEKAIPEKMKSGPQQPSQSNMPSKEENILITAEGDRSEEPPETGEAYMDSLSLHVDRTNAYSDLEKYVRAHSIAKADLLQFSGNTAQQLLTIIARRCPDAEVRLLLAHPDMAAKFDSDSGSADSVNHPAFIKKTVGMATKFGADMGYYHSPPSMSIVVLDESIVSLGWYRIFPAEEGSPILRLRGHNLPAINTYGRSSFEVLEAAQDHFNALWNTRERPSP